MKVSVLLAVYNGEKTLRQTIESILGQTYTKLELIIVNDGSTDGSERVIKEFTDSRIKYLSQKNTGSPAGPRNKAATEAMGQLIALCDQDDLWYPEKLQKQVTAYQKARQEKEVGIIYTVADFIDEKGKKIGQSEWPSQEYLTPQEAHEKMLLGIFVTACSAIFTREAFDYVGGFDESLKGNDEYDLYIRITKKYGILCLSEPLCAWRSSSTSFSNQISKMYLENEKIFAKLSKTEENRELFKNAHYKNINRIVVSSLLEGNFKRAKEFAVSGAKKDNSNKGMLISKLTLICPRFSAFAVNLLKIFGKVSV